MHKHCTKYCETKSMNDMKHGAESKKAQLIPYDLPAASRDLS